MAKVYTRTGDKGTTGIWGGQRFSKHHALLHANGDIDEANAAIGLVRAYLKAESRLDSAVIESVYAELKQVQNNLLIAGSDITNLIADAKLPQLKSSDIETLESDIDRYDNLVPPLTNFVLPSGSVLSASLHSARTITRRAERSLALLAEEFTLNPCLPGYVNRLSDYLFVLGRYIINSCGDEEEIWLNPNG